MVDIKDKTIHIDNKELKIVLVENKQEVKKIYKNEFTTEKFKKRLRQVKFLDFYKSVGGKNSRNIELEDKCSFIPMAYGFYFLLVTRKNIPTIKEMCDFFIGRFCVKNEDGTYRFKDEYINKTGIIFNKKELEAKICRGYNSWIRESLLLTELLEIQKNNSIYNELNIYYDTVEDLYNGADIIIQYDDKKIALAVQDRTPNSERYVNRKHTYRHNYEEFIEVINVKREVDNTIRVGDIDIFTKEFTKKLLNECWQKLSKKCVDNC